MTFRRRTAARLAPKSLTPFEREMAGCEAGRRDAFAGRRARQFYRPQDDDFAEGYSDGYARIACNTMTGR